MADDATISLKEWMSQRCESGAKWKTGSIIEPGPGVDGDSNGQALA